ncbi:MAG: F0F1 ATP synthase subunit A [Dehalococcoidia bacterium]|nr:F0F1 ATP synthase subunit A [Dehalococcoidia bacterium]MDW8119425.1 FoF1 ATP synthase subunit a [Chloroflexota bacterium]
MGRGTRWLVLAALVVGALGLGGLLTGAIGSAFLGREPLLHRPHVHLAADILPWSIGPFPLRNTLLSAWLATLVIVVLFVGGARTLKMVPGRWQNLIEVFIESLYRFIESVVGTKYARAFFPVIATIFIFVAFNAWLALLPIYPSLGFKEKVVKEGHVETVFVPLLRSAGTDLNMPLALALVSFVFVEFWGFRALGLAYLGKFIRLGNLLRGKIFQGFVDLFVGVLELASEFIRIVSFTFRLFGNMTAGEILLLVSAFLVSFVFSVPFYGLEILVGFVQALIFAGLTTVFVALAVAEHGEGEHH